MRAETESTNAGLMHGYEGMAGTVPRTTVSKAKAAGNNLLWTAAFLLERL